MTRPRVYLHIGMPKTGTTSIQAALHSTKGDFLYPAAGRHPEIGPEAHHVLAGATIRGITPNFGYEEPSDELWDALRKESSGHDRVIISCEKFPHADADDILRIRRNLRGMPTTVVVYLRNHWDFTVSFYKQMIKHGSEHASSFQKATERLMPWLEYDSLIERWGEHFDVRIRLFDKVKNDLLSDFASATGIKNLDLANSRNVSFGEDVLCSLRLLHQIVPGSRGEVPGRFPPLVQRIRRNIISGRSPGRYVTFAMDAIPWIRLIHPSDREWFTERTEEIRQRFLEKHVDSRDWHYFDVSAR